MAHAEKVKTLDPYVSSYLDRHGKRRHRFRLGSIDVHIPSPSDPAYSKVYEELRGKSPSGNGYCYFIGGAGLVKIGYALNVRNRLNHMQVNSPVELKLLAIAEGGMFRERAYHQRFQNERVRGEWFKLGQPIKDEIERLNAEADDAP